jgi:hypothetical protein
MYCAADVRENYCSSLILLGLIGFWTYQKEQDMQCTYKRNIEARSRIHSCRGNIESIFFVSVSVGLIIHACTVLYCHLSPVRLSYFFTFSLKRHDFQIKVRVKESRKRHGVSQRVPGGLGSKIFMTFGT